MTVTAHSPAPLHRSIPFWILVAGSAATLGVGAFILVDKLSSMSTVLLDNTATGVDVYVGQVQAILGAILIGAGALGLALSAALGVIRGLLVVRPGTAHSVSDLGYGRDLGYDDDPELFEENSAATALPDETAILEQETHDPGTDEHRDSESEPAITR